MGVALEMATVSNGCGLAIYEVFAQRGKTLCGCLGDRERKPSDDRGGGPPDSDRSRRKGEGPSRARHSSGGGEGPSRARHSSGGGEGSDPPPRGKGVKDDHYQRTSDKSQERSARSTEEGEGHEEQRRADR